jgi:hypothetical protein
MRRLINLFLVRNHGLERALGWIGRSARTGRGIYLARGGALLAVYLLTRPKPQRHISQLKAEPGTTLLVRVRQVDEEPLGVEQARALLGNQTL